MVDTGRYLVDVLLGRVVLRLQGILGRDRGGQVDERGGEVVND